MHQLLGAEKRIRYHEGLNLKGIGSLSTMSTNLYPKRRKIGFSWANGGNPRWHSQKEVIEHDSLHFGDEDFGLYHALQLYPVTNLTTLFGPRTIFLYDLFTHKKIDICGHIYYLLTKSITKRNSRTILPFPSLIMALIAKTRLKQSYHHVKGLFDWCSNDDPKQSPYHRTKNQHFTNPKGQC